MSSKLGTAIGGLLIVLGLWLCAQDSFQSTPGRGGALGPTTEITFDALQVDSLMLGTNVVFTATGAHAPTNTSTVVRWIPIRHNGTNLFLPLYQ